MSLTANTFTNRLIYKTSCPALYNAVLVVMASVFLALISQVIIPIQPVPITLQTTAVIFIGAALGPRLGAYAVALYLLEGLAGLPVFAGFQGGAAVFFTPVAGYLLGMIPSAFIHGKLMQWGMAKNVFLSFLAAVISTMVVYACGVSYFAHLTNWHTAWTLGVAPYVISAPIKLALISLILPKFWQARG